MPLVVLPPLTSSWTPAPPHAIMNATATAALVFKFCGRNPKMIARWPPHIHHETPDNSGHP